MNYLEFAQHLRQCFYLRMKPFRFDILAYGLFEAEAGSHTGRPFAFSMEAVTGDITPIIGAHDGHTAEIAEMHAYVVDEWNVVVGKVKFANIEEITGTCDVTIEFEAAKRTIFKLDVKTFTNMALAMQDADSVTLEALIASIGALELRMDVEQLTYKTFTFDIDVVGQALIDIANRAAEAVNLKVLDIGSLLLSVPSGEAALTITTLTGIDEILMAFQRWRIAVLSDYEVDTLEELENKTLGDMEYIQIQ